MTVQEAVDRLLRAPERPVWRSFSPRPEEGAAPFDGVPILVRRRDCRALDLLTAARLWALGDSPRYRRCAYEVARWEELPPPHEHERLLLDGAEWVPIPGAGDDATSAEPGR